MGLHWLGIMSLTIGRRRSGGVEILDIGGRLTLGDGTGMLREAVKKTADADLDVLLNLAGVVYVDSAGLGELVGSFASASAKGRRMKLLNPPKRVDSLLQITKLYSTFECFSDERQAIESFTL